MWSQCWIVRFYCLQGTLRHAPSLCLGCSLWSPRRFWAAWRSNVAQLINLLLLLFISSFIDKSVFCLFFNNHPCWNVKFHSSWFSAQENGFDCGMFDFVGNISFVFWRVELDYHFNHLPTERLTPVGIQGT